jgi:hypothetical protein
MIEKKTTQEIIQEDVTIHLGASWESKEHEINLSKVWISKESLIEVKKFLDEVKKFLESVASGNFTDINRLMIKSDELWRQFEFA